MSLAHTISVRQRKVEFCYKDEEVSKLANRRMTVVPSCFLGLGYLASMICLVVADRDKDQQEERQQRQHHVFIFRHCVRSTNPEVNLYDAKTEEDSAFPTAIEDYVNVSLPNWQTPVESCTQGGLDHMKAVGQYLMQNYFSQATTLEVEFITDSSKRDVTSAFELSEGLATGAQASGQKVTGLNNLQYDPYLFHPTTVIKDSAMGGISDGPTQLCEKPDNDRLIADTVGRLSNVPMPPLSISHTIKLMEKYVGIGSAGSLIDIWQKDNDSSSVDKPTLNSDLLKIQGPVNIIKSVAQIAFYSRASNIAPDFPPDMIVDEIMKMLAWHYWLRSVSDVGNIKAAMEGSVFVHRILQTLQQYRDEDSAVDHDNNHHRATFFLAHDGNIDSIATALDISWELPRPYPSAPFRESQEHDSWYPSPPASALYFASSGDSFVDVSFLTPMFFDSNGDLNVSGILEAVPPTLRSTTTYNSRTPVTTAQVVENALRISDQDPLTVLRNRMTEILSDMYAPQGMECYNASRMYYGMPAKSTNQPTPSPSSNSKVPPPPTTVVQPTSSPEPTPAASSSSPIQAPPTATSPPHSLPRHPSSSSGIGTSQGISSLSSPILVYLAVGVVFVGLVTLLRKPIARGLGLGGRGNYSDMDGSNDLDFSMEMI